MKCRHYRTALIGSAPYEWCYECGALRVMKFASPTVITNYTRWTRPVGPGGENPFPLKVLKKKGDPK